MEKFIRIKNRIYTLKFGIKSLMLLEEFSNHIGEQESVKLKFFLAIKNNHISYHKSNELLKQLITEKGMDYIEKILSETLELSLKEYQPSDLFLHIEGLYRKAVGEMGIAPQIFYEMSPAEIDIAYQGYIDRQQMAANCALIAMRKAKDSKATLINLLNEDWAQSTIAKRNETFTALGI